jgi:hypothetical protein
MTRKYSFRGFTAIQNGLPTLSGIGWVYRTFRSPGAITGNPVEFLRARVQ